MTPKKQSFQDWVEQFSVLVTDETIRIMSQHSRNNEDATKFAASMFLSRFIGTLVFRTLTEPPSINTSRKNHEDFVMKNMSEMKQTIQNAVSAGFQNAMTQYSGQPIEYYCTIKPVPEPLTETLN